MENRSGEDSAAGRPVLRLRAAILIGAAIAGVAALATAWAVWTIWAPGEDPLDAQGYALATVEDGSVESSLPLNIVASWTPEPAGVNRAAGVVTGVSVISGDSVSQGQTLYTVNLRPVVVGRGDVPAFRAIGHGATGADVTQLQHMLADLGYYAGAVDGEAGSGTVAAIREWQESIGVDTTGIVEEGDIIFIPAVPSRIALDEDVIARGESLSGGEDVVQALPTAPRFWLPVTETQAAMIPVDARVELTSPGGDLWEGFVAERERDLQSETIVVSLRGAEGTTICADECAQIPVVGETLLSSRVVTVAPVSGLVVPSAALVTGADGVVSVIDEAGARIPVTVIASAKGMSVIEGVAAGLRVQIPNETAD